MNIKRVIFNIIDITCKVVLTVIAVMMIMRGVRYAYDLGLGIFDQQPVSLTDTRTISVTISGDDSVMDIGKKLQDKGLVADARIFWVQERLSVYHDMMMPGTYELSPSMKPDEMIYIMASSAEQEEQENLPTPQEPEA